MFYSISCYSTKQNNLPPVIIQVVDLYTLQYSKTIYTTLAASSWGGSAAPFTYGINVGTSYTDPVAFEIVPNPDNTDEQNKAFIALSGGPCTLSNGVLTIKAYGKKPTVDIPIVLVSRGKY